MWEKATSSDIELWADALTEATDVIDYGNYNDWRVPNIRELRSLFNNYTETQQGLWLQAQGFSESFPTSSYFTSTTVPDTTTNAYYMWTADQETGSSNKTAGYVIVYVRGGD